MFNPLIVVHLCQAIISHRLTMLLTLLLSTCIPLMLQSLSMLSQNFMCNVTKFLESTLHVTPILSRNSPRLSRRTPVLPGNFLCLCPSAYASIGAQKHMEEIADCTARMAKLHIASPSIRAGRVRKRAIIKLPLHGRHIPLIQKTHWRKATIAHSRIHTACHSHPFQELPKTFQAHTRFAWKLFVSMPFGICIHRCSKTHGGNCRLHRAHGKIAYRLPTTLILARDLLQINGKHAVANSQMRQV